VFSIDFPSLDCDFKSVKNAIIKPKKKYNGDVNFLVWSKKYGHYHSYLVDYLIDFSGNITDIACGFSYS
jgi:hypothetical protein